MKDISLYLHIGYLIDVDDTGVVLSLGHKYEERHGRMEHSWKWSRRWVFPHPIRWVRHRLMMRRYRQMERRNR